MQILILLLQTSLRSAPNDMNRQSHGDGPLVQISRGHRGKHRFLIRFEAAKFKVGKRRLTFYRLGPPGPDAEVFPRINGKKVFGQDGISPIKGLTPKAIMEKRFTELISLRASIDGKPLSIPRALVQNLLDPSIASDVEHLSRDGKTLIVEMSGSDGAGGYQVTWRLRRSGRSTRRMQLED